LKQCSMIFLGDEGKTQLGDYQPVLRRQTYMHEVFSHSTFLNA
jgi:hypothetical protein